MAKLCLKKKSKRIPARRRYKIEKKVREHNRKLRKEAKKNPRKVYRSKVVQVPNVCPFKEEILKEVDAYKQMKEEERLRRRQEWKEQKEKEKEEAEAKETSLEHVVQSAETRRLLHEHLGGAAPAPQDREPRRHISKAERPQAFYREFRKVVQAADVILEVVDARDPLGTRCRQVEEAVRAAPGNKRLVLVLNKADLVPRDNLDGWLRYLRHSHPAVPFKASTQQQSRKLGRRKMRKKTKGKEMQVSVCVGAELLMSLLANYCRNRGIKTAISVGIVGLPNVGKSSIINSLKRSRACNVGAMPGVTRNLQEVQLDSKIKLIDSPGIVFSKAMSGDASAVLKNAVSTDTLAEPVVPATAILQKADKQQMMAIYNIPDYSSPPEFFHRLAVRLGRFKKRGVADPDAAARVLIDDWNRGRIKYYTVPPEEREDVHVSAEIVQSEVAEFDLASFEAMETEVMGNLEVERTRAASAVTIMVPPSQPVDIMDTSNATSTGLLADAVTVTVDDGEERKRRKEGPKGGEQEVRDRKMERLLAIDGNTRLNKLRKVTFKKEKKERARKERYTAAETATTMTADDSYDFTTDFGM